LVAANEDSNASACPGIVNDKVIHLHSNAVKVMSPLMMDKTLMKISATVKERMFNKHKHAGNQKFELHAPLNQYAFSEEDEHDELMNSEGEENENEKDRGQQNIRPASMVSSWSIASSWSDSSSLTEQRYHKKRNNKGQTNQSLGGLSARQAMLARLSTTAVNNGVANTGFSWKSMNIETEISSEDIDKLFTDLKEDIYLQRQQLQVLQLLPASSVASPATKLATANSYLEAELEKFDRLWHLNQQGEFAASAETESTGNQEAFVRRLKKDLLRTKQGSRHLVQELQELQRMVYASNNQYRTVSTIVGVEILHAFVMDLLGRDTLAARIFDWKVKQQRQQQQMLYVRPPLLSWSKDCSSICSASSHSLKDSFIMSATPVARWQKILAIVLLIVINGCAALFTLFRGYEKGMHWQQSFAIAVVFQILFEVLFTETIDCLCIAFFVPNMIAEEVIRINALLCDVVQEICSSSSVNKNSQATVSSPGIAAFSPAARTVIASPAKEIGQCKEPVKALNVPDYFFVSTNVAKSFPSLLESMIVLSYQSYLPGEFGRKWSRNTQDNSKESGINSWGLMNCKRSWWRPSILVTQQVSAVTALLLTLFVSMPTMLQQLVVRLMQIGLVSSIGRLLLALKSVFDDSANNALPASSDPVTWSTGQIALIAIVTALVLLPLCYWFVRRYGSKSVTNRDASSVATGHRRGADDRHHKTASSSSAVGIMPPQSPLSPLSAIMVSQERLLANTSVDLESPLRSLGLSRAIGTDKDKVSSDGVMSMAVGANVSDRGEEVDLELDLDFLDTERANRGHREALASSWSTIPASHSPLHSQQRPHGELTPHSPSMSKKALSGAKARLHKAVRENRSHVSVHNGNNDEKSDESDDSWGNQTETSFSNSVLTSCTSRQSIRTNTAGGSLTQSHHRRSHKKKLMHNKKPRALTRSRSLRNANHRIIASAHSHVSQVHSEDVTNTSERVHQISSSRGSERSIKSGASFVSSVSGLSFSSLSLSNEGQQDSDEFDFDDSKPVSSTSSSRDEHHQIDNNEDEENSLSCSDASSSSSSDPSALNTLTSVVSRFTLSVNSDEIEMKI
jgi:hypothetical protein